MSDMNTQNMMWYESQKKSVGIAYLFWFFLGLFGGHRFYLKKRGTAASILTITLMSFLVMGFSAMFMDMNDLSPQANDSSPQANDLSPQANDSSPQANDSSPQANDSFVVSFIFGLVMFLISIIWVLVDAFYISQIVRIYNDDLAAWLKG